MDFIMIILVVYSTSFSYMRLNLMYNQKFKNLKQNIFHMENINGNCGGGSGLS